MRKKAVETAPDGKVTGAETEMVMYVMVKESITRGWMGRLSSRRARHEQIERDVLKWQEKQAMKKL